MQKCDLQTAKVYEKCSIPAKKVINETMQGFKEKIEGLELERNGAAKRLKDEKLRLRAVQAEVPEVQAENERLALHVKRCGQRREKTEEESRALVEQLALIARQFVQQEAKIGQTAQALEGQLEAQVARVEAVQSQVKLVRQAHREREAHFQAAHQQLALHLN